MRIIACLVLGMIPGLATAGPQCGLPAPAAAVPAPNVVADDGHLRADPMPPSPLPPVSADELRTAPALRHIAEAGAHLEELGSAHGLEAVVARHGDEFKVLQVTPDKAAVIEGVQTDLSLSQIRRLAGKQQTDLGTIHGVQALLIRNGARFQVIYATPDAERVIPGSMYDDAGKNLTREQVEAVPGIAPSVEVGGPATQPNSPQASATGAALGRVKQAAYGTTGSGSGPQLWMFIDPQCSFSVRAFQQLQPYLIAGKLQLAVIPVSILDYEDRGASTRAALSMLSLAPDAMIPAWSHQQLGARTDEAAGTKLKGNMAIASAVGLRGTPTFFWRKRDGSEGRADGLPNDLSTFIGSIARDSND